MNSELQAIGHWKTYAKEFSPDGSLREILVPGTNEADWREALQFIKSRGYGFTFRGKWAGQTFPEPIAMLFTSTSDEERAVLSINLSGVVLNCHFLAASQIEIDLDPCEVTDGQKLASLFGFMLGLATSLGKDVLMTPEGQPEDAIFRCHPNNDSIEYCAYFHGARSAVLFDNG